eukprot:Selendium_serpulae@DN6442_c0_g1_i1.p2
MRDRDSGPRQKRLLGSSSGGPADGSRGGQKSALVNIKCLVCDVGEGKYRFKCCPASRFCCVECYESHSRSCVPASAPAQDSSAPTAATASASGREMQSNNKSPRGGGNTKSPKRARSGKLRGKDDDEQASGGEDDNCPSGEDENEDEDEDDRPTLNPTQQEALLNNAVLLNYLKSERLRQAVCDVDGSCDKIGALTSYLSDPDFANFADDVLRAIAPDTYGGTVTPI